MYSVNLSRALKLLGSNSISATVRAILQIIQVYVLSNNLSADELGTLAIYFTLYSTGIMLSDFGISSALVYFNDISERERTLLFWVSQFISIVIGGLILSSSRFMEDYFEMSDLSSVLYLLVFVFPIYAAFVHYKSWFEKHLLHDKLYTIEIIQALIGFIVLFSLIVKGTGIQSVPYSIMVSYVIAICLIIYKDTTNFLPLHKFHLKDLKRFLNFNVGIIADGLFNQLTRNIDVLLIGKILGPSNLGLYSVPRNFLLNIQFIINPIISRLLYPKLSSVKSHHGMRNFWFWINQKLISNVSVMIYGTIAIFASYLVMYYFGNSWQGYEIFIRLISFWAAVRAILSLQGVSVIASGGVWISFIWNVSFGLVSGFVYLLVIPKGLLTFAYFLPFYLLISSVFYMILVTKRYFDISFQKLFSTYVLELAVLMVVMIVSSMIQQLVLLLVLEGVLIFTIGRQLQSEYMRLNRG